MTKKTISAFMSAIALLACTTLLTSATPQKDEVMTKENGMYVVNTTTLGKDIIGYVDTTPVKVYIKKNKVVKVEALKNQETPKYMAKVKKNLMTKWDGQKIADAQKLQVDAVTGATFTSEAIKENVQLALDYYKKHK